MRWSKETSGTGLTTTENWEFAIGAKEEMKEGVTVLAARRKKEWESIPVCRLRQKKIGAAKPTINYCWWSRVGVNETTQNLRKRKGRRS